MAFVLVACRESNRERARVLAAKFVARGVDVCSDLEQAPTEVRAGAYRAAIDHGALMVALWSEDDHADAAYVDHMLYAQRSGRLFAVAIGDARLPGILGGEDGATSAFDDGDADAVAQRVSELDAQGDVDTQAHGSVAQETKAFLRVQRRRSANSLARFLREYPEGMFEHVVRDQLDAETRPHYQPDQPASGGGWFGALAQKLRFDGAHAGGGQDEHLAKQVWRMDASPWSAARDIIASVAQRARSPVGLAIAGLIFFGVLGFAGLRLIHWPQARSLPAAVAIAPRDAYADAQARNVTAGPLAPSASTPAATGEVARPVDRSLEAFRGPAREVLESPRPPAAQAAEFSPPVQTATVQIQPNPLPGGVSSGDVAPHEIQTESRAESDARAIQLARRQDTVAGYNAYLAAFPSGAFASEARGARDNLLNGPPPYDLTQLEPNARALVQRARAGEASANAEATRRSGAIVVTRPGAGEGNYRGATSGGVASGLGKAVWSNGDVYAGSWSGSLPHGFGVLRLVNGSRYEGEFAGGAPTGRGVFWNEEGRRLQGDRLFAALVRARSQ